MKAIATIGCLVLAMAVAGPAAADSLVFIRANNVWLANADGTGQYQVTLDGTASSPYSSPSQADDGTIVALRTPAGGRPQIWRMHQNGGLLNPPINTPAPGTGAIDARVSPDGQLVAYWFVTVRTVEAHLHHAYQKLGISSREQLAAALGGSPPRPVEV